MPDSVPLVFLDNLRGSIHPTGQLGGLHNKTPMLQCTKLPAVDINILKPVLWMRNDFFSDPDPDHNFQLVSDFHPDPVSDLTLIFSNILNLNFTFVFPSCKCVRLHIMTRFLGKHEQT